MGVTRAGHMCLVTEMNRSSVTLATETERSGKSLSETAGGGGALLAPPKNKPLANYIILG